MTDLAEGGRWSNYASGRCASCGAGDYQHFVGCSELGGHDHGSLRDGPCPVEGCDV